MEIKSNSGLRRSIENFIWILFLIQFYSCQPEYLGKEELVDYIKEENNGLSKVQKYGDTEIEVSYRPTDLLILQENGWDPVISQQRYESLKDKYEDQFYFNLSLSKNNEEIVNIDNVGAGRFSKLIKTLSFRMAEFVNLTTAKQDTITVADYIFSRTYGMGRSNTLLFVFSKDKLNNDKWMQFNLKEFGLELGNINFRFDQEDINNIPKIKFRKVNKNNN